MPDLIAAIYARKSTDQSNVSDDAKSVARQVEHARDYAVRKGWIVEDAHVFVDDGISGAEFANRPGFLRLMNELKPRPPFQVLVMMEESRLGRETIETAYAMKQLVQAGVRVFFYLSDRERTLDSPMDKVMLSLTAFADELEREKARQRTYDAMARIAKAGHVTGGAVFGYTNVTVLGSDGKPSHVERRINESQAAIVRNIFDRYVHGEGYGRIARALNAAHASSPRPTEHKPAGWSPSSVRSVLRQELYRGVVVWNQSRKRDAWGRQRQTARPETEWITLPVNESLRIIADESWDAVQARFRHTRMTLETTQGPRAILRRDIGSKYLLSGFARCATCGWSMTVVTRPHGTRPHRRRVAFLGCLSHYKRGPTVCPNGRLVRLDAADEAVLTALVKDTDPLVITALVEMVFRQLAPAQGADHVEALRRDLRGIDAKIATLTSAIEAGGAALPSLIARLNERQQERDRLVEAIGAAGAVSAIQRRQQEVEAKVQAQVLRLRAYLGQSMAAPQSVEDGRQALRESLRGPLVFTPTATGYHFRAPTTTGALIAGAVTYAQQVASPPGFEPGFQP
jgi:site-specific DNA recombinase